MDVAEASSVAAGDGMETGADDADKPQGFALVVKLVGTGGKQQLAVTVPSSASTTADVKQEVRGTAAAPPR